MKRLEEHVGSYEIMFVWFSSCFPCLCCRHEKCCVSVKTLKKLKLWVFSETQRFHVTAVIYMISIFILSLLPCFHLPCTCFLFASSHFLFFFFFGAHIFRLRAQARLVFFMSCASINKNRLSCCRKSHDSFMKSAVRLYVSIWSILSDRHAETFAAHHKNHASAALSCWKVFVHSFIQWIDQMFKLFYPLWFICCVF